MICCLAGSLFKKTMNLFMFKRRQLLGGCRVPVVSRQPACYSIGWRWFARCGRIKGERTELTQGFVKSSCHLTNCMLVDDQPWHRFHSFLYYSVLDSPVSGWKMHRSNFSTPPVDREHMRRADDTLTPWLLKLVLHISISVY